MHPYQGDSCPSKRAAQISCNRAALRTRIVVTYGAVDRVTGQSHDEDDDVKLPDLQGLDARPARFTSIGLSNNLAAGVEVNRNQPL